jgi:hypothetical protein
MSNVAEPPPISRDSALNHRSSSEIVVAVTGRLEALPAVPQTPAGPQAQADTSRGERSGVRLRARGLDLTGHSQQHRSMQRVVLSAWFALSVVSVLDIGPDAMSA